MGYLFHGFFASYADGLLAAAAEQWPTARARMIHEHFYGVGLRAKDYRESQDDEEAERILAIADEVGPFSLRFPETTFVYIEVDCFGGTCVYEGVVWRGGERVVTETGDGALRRLLSHLGARLDDREYFRPFERSYLW